MHQMIALSQVEKGCPPDCVETLSAVTTDGKLHVPQEVAISKQLVRNCAHRGRADDSPIPLFEITGREGMGVEVGVAQAFWTNENLLHRAAYVASTVHSFYVFLT